MAVSPINGRSSEERGRWVTGPSLLFILRSSDDYTTAMNDVLRLIRDRRSVRTPFDPYRTIGLDDLRNILESGRWAPTAHNMQNFEILMVDDRKVLETLGSIRSPVSETFLRENYEQLSFSEEELRRKKVGILAADLPPSWADPSKFGEVAEKSHANRLEQTIAGSPLVLIVIYDPVRRAPDSEGDLLGLVSLGCLMENMWLMATSLGISVRIMSDLGDVSVQDEVKRTLGIPDHLRIVYGLRLGYPASSPAKGLRVRRDLVDLTHRNLYGNRGLE